MSETNNEPDLPEEITIEVGGDEQGEREDLAMEKALAIFMTDNRVAQQVFGEAIAHLFETWFKYGLPPSVVLFNVKMLGKVIEQNILSAVENKELAERSIATIDDMVDFLTNIEEEEKENGTTALFKMNEQMQDAKKKVQDTGIGGMYR